MVRLQSWHFEECGVTPSLLLPGAVVHVRVQSMGQIELFNPFQEIISISYLKPYSGLQVVCIKK